MRKFQVIYAPERPAGASAARLEAAVPGIEVRLAGDLRSVETALAAGDCDLVVSSYSLPGFDALALLHARNSAAPAVPVIIVAPGISCGKCQELVRVGADAVVPSEKEDLLAGFVRNALDGAGLRPANAAEAEKLASLGRLAGCVAHDFNNILGAIEGYATLNLRRLAADDPLKADLGEIRKAVARAGALNRQLLLFSRTYPAPQKPVNAVKLLSGLKEAFGPLAGDGVSLELDAPEGLPDAAGDMAELGQALLNLALNARDAMPGGGVVRVKAEAVSPAGPAAAYLRISVADSGPGIPPGQMASVFEPFFTTKPKGKGLGLGLSSVYGIIRRHGGRVDLRTAPTGSVFSILLPTPAATLTAPEVAPAAASAAPVRGATVLILEDDAELMGISARALKEAGYRTLEAGTMSSARDILGRRGGEVKLVLADIVLPDGRSTDAVDELLRLAPGAGLVFTSGYDQSEELRSLLAGRGFRFLQKPYSAEALVAAVSAGFKI